MYFQNTLVSPLLNLFAHTVAVLKLHHWKQNNPLLNYNVMECVNRIRNLNQLAFRLLPPSNCLIVGDDRVRYLLSDKFSY